MAIFKGTRIYSGTGATPGIEERSGEGVIPVSPAQNATSFFWPFWAEGLERNDIAVTATVINDLGSFDQRYIITRYLPENRLSELVIPEFLEIDSAVFSDEIARKINSATNEEITRSSISVIVDFMLLHHQGN